MSKTIIMFVSDYKNPDNPKNKILNMIARTEAR